MGIKRIVDTSFWTDGKVDDFSPEDKYFMLYLLTNPFTTQLGIYEISIKQVAFQLGYSTDTVKVLLDRFENKYGMIRYSKNTKEVAVKNYLRHSIIKGGAPVRDCIVKELKKVKDKDLVEWVFGSVKGFESLNPTVRNIIAEYEEQNGVIYYHNEKDKDNDNENDNENEVTYHVTLTLRSVVNYLNQKTGSNYRETTPKTRKLVEARLKEGFNENDFKTVIDKKCADWLGDAKMEQYLRPETLFGTKFEGYLNAKTTKPVNTAVQGDQTDLDDVWTD